ncbi:MAG: hypothetical protein KDI43_16320 [Gammaproteobacteria bacterium]|nr:hypothetical protein [Gammaproteobacteria bacterium]MCB1870028.1 hypothetical protein [Gammaproteobacteria bacterium]
MKIHPTLLAAALASVFAFCAGIPAFAADAHQHAAGEPTKLTLDHGKKWATDEVLRKGMTEIRNAVAADEEAIHTGKMSAARYDALAKKIDGQLADVVQNCKLPPEADAQLHLVLAEMIQGQEAIKGQDKKPDRRAGVVKVIDALDAYNKHFDHPGWRGPK